jgi:carbonic anhydrase
MEKLLKGIIKFKTEDYKKYEDVFGRLKDSQKPHTLFIGCSDSRVVPTLITKALPGELFIVRNVANIVPPFRETDEYLGTQASIEYAVNILKVENIIVCGHSNCGGCGAILNYYTADFQNIDSVKRWLKLGLPALEKLEKYLATGKNKTDESVNKNLMIEQLNILEQIKNLLTFPYIAKKQREGKLNIYGWYYIIETGDIFNYNKDKKYFELVGA